MLVNLLIRWGIVAASFAVTAWLLDGVHVDGGFLGYVWVSLLFGIVNIVVGTILRIITLPLAILTLGLILIVVNAVVLELTDALTDDLTIDDFFWSAILAAIVMSITTVVLELVLGRRGRG